MGRGVADVAMEMLVIWDAATRYEQDCLDRSIGASSADRLAISPDGQFCRQKDSMDRSQPSSRSCCRGPDADAAIPVHND
jgi:hypothetical protein